MRIERVPLSAATDWLSILLTQTSTPGDVIHIPTTDTDVVDEIYLWAQHPGDGAGAVKLTIEFGGVATKDKMVTDLPDESTIQVVSGRPLSGALTIAGFAATGSLISVWGYVNRIFL